MLQINWDQVAERTGYKNGSVASVRFGQIKKKLGWNSNNGGSGPAARVVKTRSPAKPRGGGAAGRGGRKPVAKKSPATGGRGAGRRAKGKKVKDEAESDSEDEKEEVEVVVLMAGSDDEDVEDSADEEESFEARVNRGVYNDSEQEDEGDLSDAPLAQLKKNVVQKNAQAQEEEYDAYDPDAVFADAEEEQAPVERQLYIPNHA